MQKKQPVSAALSHAEVLPSQVTAILPGVVYQMHDFPDGTSRFTFVNEASRSLLGLEPEAMMSDIDVYRRRIHPDDLEGILTDMAQHRRHLLPWTRQFRFKIPRRGERWLQSMARLERLPDGRVQWTGFLTDITRMKNAEDALLLSEKRFGEAWRGSRVGMALVSLHGRWLEVNPALCEFLGRSEAELLATDFQSITHPDDLEADLSLVQQLLDGQISDYSMEKRYSHPEKHYVWGVLTVVLLRDSSGAPLHFLSQVQDIDQRKRAEEDLRISEERIALAAKAGHVGMWDFDFRTRTVVWNDAQYAIHGVRREDYEPSVEKNMLFVHPDEREAVLAGFRHCIESGQTRYEIDCRIIRADGETRVTRANALIIRDQGGRPLRMVGTEVDITEERQLVETLARARHAAEAATRTKSEFLARMSHEIRTPLNAILAPGHLLAASDLTSAQRELSTMIVGAGEHLLQVINDILDFSKLEAGKLKVVTEPLDLDKLAEEVKALMSILAESKGLALRAVVDSSLRGTWFGDSGRIKQILINLVSNAIKYSSHGEVTLRILAGDTSEKIPFVRFEVQDMGFGLSVSQQTKLFQPFEQVGHRDWENGTGLGLAICRDLVELMGGTIDCTSQPGQGSRFWFDIPLQKKGARRRLKRRASGIKNLPTRKSRILVAEDNPSNRRVASLLLRRLGHTTLFAVNGLQAVEKIEEEDIDLILMDCEMPVMNGLESTQEIRRRPKGKNLPVIALTAHVSADHRRACLDSGMDDLLSKPLIVEELQNMLTRWLPRS